MLVTQYHHLVPNNESQLIIGVIFLVTGMLLCIRYRWRNAKAYFPIIIGACLVLFSLGPLSNGRSAIEKLKRISGSEVSSIVLQPTSRTGLKSMVSRDFYIKNAAEIQSFCSALRFARTADENLLKHADTASIVTINFVDHTRLVLGVRTEGHVTRIDINSAGEQGWHYAVLRSDDLKSLIQDAIQ